MRWLPWALGIVGVLQYAVIAALSPSDYVSVDTAYLVMWLAIIGGVLTCYLSCWGGGCGCDCDHCGECSSGGCCGECACCGPNVAMKGGSGGMGGHEGHDHGPGEHHH